MGERDERVGGSVWKEFESGIYEWEEVLDAFEVWNDGAWPREGCSERCKCARLMGEMGRQGIVSGLESDTC